MAAYTSTDPASKAIAEMIKHPVSNDMIAFVSYKASTVIHCEPRPSAPPAHHHRSTSSGWDIPALPTFVEQVARRSNVRAGTFLASAVYLDRLEKRLPKEASGMYCTLHRVFLAALIITSKYINDASPKNRHWSRCSGCFSLAEVNLMESQLLSLLDFDLSISSSDLNATLNPLLPISSISLAFPIPPTSRLQSKSLAGLVAARQSQTRSQIFKEELARTEMGDWDNCESDSDDDSDDEDELVDQPMVSVTIAPNSKSAPHRVTKICDVDSPLDPYTPFSPILSMPYAHVIHPHQHLSAGDVEGESEVDTFLRPFGLENDAQGNWLEGLVSGWGAEDDDDEYDDEDEMEEMERDDGDDDEELSSYSLPTAMSVPPVVHYHRDSTYPSKNELAPISHRDSVPSMRRLSASSSVASSVSASSDHPLRTPTDFHNDFHPDFHSDFTTASLEPVIVQKQLQYNAFDLGTYDNQSVYSVFKHGAHEAPKRPWKSNSISNMSLNSKPPFAGGYVAPAFEAPKDYRTGGIFARVFRQASRHR